MKRIRLLAQYYVDLVVKLGIVRCSILLATVLSALTIVLMIIVTLLLQGSVERFDIIRAILFSLLITPCAVYFLSIIIERLEMSRRELSVMVDELELMHQRDSELHIQLQSNIERLNREINVRIKAEEARQTAIEELQTEIANREHAQIELEQQSSLLRSFLDASPDLVFYRNEQGKFSGCNRAMELLTGKGEKQLIGLTAKEVYSAEVARKILETDEKVFQHHVSITFELWIEYPDGRKSCFEVRKVPFYDKLGNRQGLMGFGRDITEHKRYQEALEKASRDKTTFISTISHELRTPLNGIVGLSRILLDMTLNPEQEKYLKTIHVSAITLGNIFNDIIELDKIERRKTQLNKQSIDFIDFLTDLENISGLLVEPKGLSFSLEKKDDLPSRIMADDTRLRQILWNLISNAVKFTHCGGVKVRVWYDVSGKVYFEVKDSGVGIPLAEQDKIFAMYYQVKQSDNAIPGTGIGLAVSRRLAQAMGGNITVKSEPSKGSIFTVVLDAPAMAAESQLDIDHDESLPVLHILLVEDIELNVVVARAVLEKLGHSVDVAMTGKEALALFEPDAYDLVLLDIQLPDMTGFDIARQIKQRYPNEILPPLVALTANVLSDKQKYIDAGIDDVLGKPLVVDALVTIIKRFWDPQPKVAVWSVASSVKTIVVPIQEHSYDSLLDVAMLEQYMQLVGPSLIYQGLELFDKMMPGYMATLNANMVARDQDSIAEEAHKIKGAAGSVGLKHLQQLAQQIQTPTLPAWWDNVQDWIDELNHEWRNDCQVLCHWVDQARNQADKE